MARVNFPNSPTDGQVLDADGLKYTYDNTKGNWRSSNTVSGMQYSSLSVSTASASGSGGVAYNGGTGVVTYTPPSFTDSTVLVYATAADLPLVGSNAGDQAYVTATNRLYIWNGTGWFNIALLNTSPTITTGGAATYALSEVGDTVITLVATDPEDVPITWSYAVTSGSLGSSATVSQADNVFTVTAAAEGAFSLTFTASDGINLATSTSAFTLAFAVPIWQGTNSGVNITPPAGGNGNFAQTGVKMTDDYYIAADKSDYNGVINSRVYLFNRSDNSLAYTITDPTETSNQFWGTYVVADGNYIVVGSLPALINNTGASTVDVYDTSTFTTSTITSPNFTLTDPWNSAGAASNKWGKLEMHISGNYLVIPDRMANGGGTSGVAYGGQQGMVYVYDISTFASSTITAPNYYIANPNAQGTSAYDYFGDGCAIKGNRLAISANEQSSSGVTGDGIVYAYDISTFSSNLITSPNLYTLANPNYGGGSNTIDYFAQGESLAMGDDYLVAGAIRNDTPFANAGTVYIFNAANGSLLYTIAGPDASGTGNWWFGRAIEVDGDNLYVMRGNNVRLHHYDIGNFTSSTPAVIAAGTASDNTLNSPGYPKFSWDVLDGKLLKGQTGSLTVYE